MSRVATLTTQHALVSALGRGQASLADANVQLSTTKRVQDYAGLGGDTRRVLSASTMLAQQHAQSDVAKRITTTLGFYAGALDALDSTVSDLKTKLLKAVGDSNGSAVDQQAQEAFTAVAGALNTSEAGVPIFGGGQTEGKPFLPNGVADLLALSTPEAAFANDDRLASARLEDGVDVTYGITADSVGVGVTKALKTLAGLGPFVKELTPTQITGLNTVMGQLDDATVAIRSVNARNGDLQNHVEVLGQRAESRVGLLMSAIGDGVDANLSQVASDLSTRTMVLNASYSAFTRLNALSLVNFLGA